MNPSHELPEHCRVSLAAHHMSPVRWFSPSIYLRRKTNWNAGTTSTKGKPHLPYFSYPDGTTRPKQITQPIVFAQLHFVRNHRLTDSLRQNFSNRQRILRDNNETSSIHDIDANRILDRRM
jgi:hypothetical protein